MDNVSLTNRYHVISRLLLWIQNTHKSKKGGKPKVQREQELFPILQNVGIFVVPRQFWADESTVAKGVHRPCSFQRHFPSAQVAKTPLCVQTVTSIVSKSQLGWFRGPLRVQFSLVDSSTSCLVDLPTWNLSIFAGRGGRPSWLPYSTYLHLGLI